MICLYMNDHTTSTVDKHDWIYRFSMIEQIDR